MIQHLEDALQMSCIQWFRVQYPGRVMFHIPNGRARLNIRQASRLKKLGVLAGVPDLFIPEPAVIQGATGGRIYNGLFVELKAGDNEVTAKQQAMIDVLRVRGYAVHVCYTLDEFMSVVNAYFRTR